MLAEFLPLKAVMDRPKPRPPEDVLRSQQRMREADRVIREYRKLDDALKVYFERRR